MTFVDACFLTLCFQLKTKTCHIRLQITCLGAHGGYPRQAKESPRAKRVLLSTDMLVVQNKRLALTEIPVVILIGCSVHQESTGIKEHHF